MKYHSHKMMEINDTAQALWNKCYQGTDIDTIMIKSDHEGASKVRTYNYRVRGRAGSSVYVTAPQTDQSALPCRLSWLRTESRWTCADAALRVRKC